MHSQCPQPMKFATIGTFAACESTFDQMCRPTRFLFGIVQGQSRTVAECHTTRAIFMAMGRLNFCTCTFCVSPVIYNRHRDTTLVSSNVGRLGLGDEMPVHNCRTCTAVEHPCSWISCIYGSLRAASRRHSKMTRRRCSSTLCGTEQCFDEEFSACFTRVC